MIWFIGFILLVWVVLFLVYVNRIIEDVKYGKEKLWIFLVTALLILMTIFSQMMYFLEEWNK